MKRIKPTYQIVKSRESALVGCLLGTAAGDSIGLPYEGLSPARAARMFGEPVGHRFLIGLGMVSDDTEHTCMVAQALIASGGEVEAFRRSLAWRLQFWLLGLPAGVGFATLRALLKLWVGFSPKRSGVFSAGNGPAMRSMILGAAIDDEAKMVELVRASTRITHTDPKAEYGALAVALAAHMAREPDVVEGNVYLERLTALLPDDEPEIVSLLRDAIRSADDDETTKAFAASIGQERGVSGYVNHTVPVVIHAWLSNQRGLNTAIKTVIECGGDADTTAAIVGGIVGTSVGADVTADGATRMPTSWLENLIEWPRSVSWMKRLGARLAETMEAGAPRRPVGVFLPGVILRNIVFLVVVLIHGLRRALPPY